MKFTGERFVPEVQGNIQLEHVHRYLQACSLAANKVVLDIASGEGYGSSMLAEVAQKVYGVDISEEAVKHASARYQSSNLEFRVGSCASIPLPDRSVDFVVSFETIEHHEQHEEMMLELRRVLKADGVLLISSPDKLYYSDIPASHNEYHVKELYESEFKRLLERHFSFCAYFGQRIVYGSGIFPENIEGNIGFQFQTYQQTDRGIQASDGMPQPVYWIALASMQALPSVSAGLFEQPQKSSEMVASLQTALNHREQDISLQKNWIQHLETDILVLKNALADTEVKQEQWQQQVNSLNQHLEQSESQLADFKQEILRQERYLQQEFSRLNDARENTLAKWHQTLQELTQIQAQMSEQEKQLQLQQHDFRKANEANLKLREQLALLEIKLVEQASIANQIQEEQNNKLLQQESQLVTICHERDAALAQYSHLRASTSWRMTSPFRALAHLIRGNLSPLKFGLRALGRKLMQAVPTSVKGIFKRTWSKFLNVTALMPHSSMNQAAVASLVEERNEIRPLSVAVPPLLQFENCPTIDINAVTYNNGQWLDGFVKSLLALNYPKSCLRLYFVDNASTDNTLEKLQEVATVLREQHIFVEILSKPNRGFGAGHNAAIAVGKSDFFLITNVDLEFEADALLNVVSAAIADVPTAAAWELRQKPFEHPKYYDPITGSTNWNAYACVLLRRSALQKVGGFDETLFMYGEDVELSYRLRRAGFILRYCPRAVVWHFTYESAGQTKRLQYSGSTFANLYLRLKYGNRWDMLAVPLMGLRLLLAPQAYSGARRDIFFNWLRLTWLLPKILLGRRASSFSFPFREWDYEMIRDGAFLNLPKIPHDAPLVSVITRTYAGREHYLRQAIISVARQTYPNIEHIIVEDGGTKMQSLVEEMQIGIDRPLRFFGLHKCGRSATGNHGMKQSRGRWCVFLDDDDLLFSDHVEVLVNTVLQQPEVVAAYTLAWEVVTDSAKLIDGEYIEHTYKVPAALRQTFDYDVLRHHNFMPIQSVLFARSLFEERGGFDEDMDALEDWTLWVRYAHGNLFVHVPKLTSLFRTPFSEDSIRQRVAAFGDAYPLALARHETQTKAIDAAQRAELGLNQKSSEQPELIS